MATSKGKNQNNLGSKAAERLSDKAAALKTLTTDWAKLDKQHAPLMSKSGVLAWRMGELLNKLRPVNGTAGKGQPKGLLSSSDFVAWCKQNASEYHVQTLRNYRKVATHYTAEQAETMGLTAMIAQLPKPKAGTGGQDSSLRATKAMAFVGTITDRIRRLATVQKAKDLNHKDAVRELEKVNTAFAVIKSELGVAEQAVYKALQTAKAHAEQGAAKRDETVSRKAAADKTTALALVPKA